MSEKEKCFAVVLGYIQLTGVFNEGHAIPMAIYEKNEICQKKSDQSDQEYILLYLILFLNLDQITSSQHILLHGL